MSRPAPVAAPPTSLKVKDLFAADVTRDIPPVVYFHEQSPDRLAAEVGEYIVTGGYPEGDPRARRVRNGIHEQLVALFRAISKELDRKPGPELPASWISGFYGSGKSSFAKLVGLALDGALLPDGTPLADGLIRRDESPRRAELAEAWAALRGKIDPLAVVFDIGAVARDGEHVHAAVLRRIRTRLGYCPKSSIVADFELRLELDGRYPAFLEAARKTLGRPWDAAKNEELAEDHFSHVLYVIDHERYLEPVSWIDSRAGARHGGGSSVEEAVRDVADMMRLRAPGKTLFVVVDEVSQYVHQNDERMLKLQSFVSDLGQRLKGRVWLLATGQQKLEEGLDASGIGKLKDRFPPALRVHLDPANIRDVVHKRLLKKAPAHEAALRALFQRHRPDLKLYGYACDEITEEDFVEVYPLLPGHIELFMDITSRLRTRSRRVQGDDHAVRGLLQLMGEVFRAQRMGDEEAGALLTLDRIFDVQRTALDEDAQVTLERILEHPEVRGDPIAVRAAKAVSLLELLQEDKAPTTPRLVAQCLYQRLGAGDGLPAVTAALDRMRTNNLLAYSEKHGFKIQSSSGQEWEREREGHGVTSEEITTLVHEALRQLMAGPELPKLKGRPFPYSVTLSDGRGQPERRVLEVRSGASVPLDCRWLSQADERRSELWVKRSDETTLRDRLIWVAAETSSAQDVARELARSRLMVDRYKPRRESLVHEKQRLLVDEQTRAEALERRLRDVVAQAFVDGGLYFRSRPLAIREHGAAFSTALTGAASRVLSELYPHFIDIAITDGELAQLLAPQLSGPSAKFMEKGLGILALDSGKYVPRCDGEAPERIRSYLTELNGASGATLIGHFSRAPFGYPVDVLRACLAGLLRAGKIRIRPEEGPELTSIRDPGAQDLFTKDRALRTAEVFPAGSEAITTQDRVAICKFFQRFLKVELDRENDPIADAVFQHFPVKRAALRDLERRFDLLPGRPPLPAALQRLAQALEDCRRSRQVEDTVKATKRNLDALKDGLEQLAIAESELTEAAIDAIREAWLVRETHLSQLRNAGAAEGLEDAGALLEAHLGADRPWREIATLAPPVAQVRARYKEERARRLAEQGVRGAEATARLRLRRGFAKLEPEEIERVLRPINEAATVTTPDAIAPSLVALHDEYSLRLGKAVIEAEERLDELLSRGKERIVRVEARIAGREIASKEELQTLVRDLEDRVGSSLAPGVRVRIV